MHQQEVGGVRLLTFHLRYTSSHGNCGYTCGTDQRIDLAAGELAQQLAQQQTADGGEAECKQTQTDNQTGFHSQEAFTNGGSTNGDAQEDGNDVHQCVLSGVGQTVGAAGFTPQVAQHQAANQRSGGGQQQNDEACNNDGEYDFFYRRII